MNILLTKKVLEAFEHEGVEYKIFGAVALNLHGLARATEDLDVFIAPSADNVSKLQEALRSVFDDPTIDEIDADELIGDYPAIQYVPPENGFHIDILTRLGEMHSYQSLESLRVDLQGLEVTVITPRALYEMKKATVRPKDWGDAQRLRLNFDVED